MEKLMQYVWQYGLWPSRDTVTVDGHSITILDPGLLNTNSGPDFFNAKILIDGRKWAGNIEIHVRASDWYRHGHDTDRAYDTVILHVVEVDDARIHRPNGEEIPQMVMTCARDFNERYQQMVNDPYAQLPCARELPELDSIYLTDWITTLGFERLYEKVDRLLELVERLDGRWSDAIYITLARALGFGTNAEPFELLARSTPLNYLLRQASELSQIEAILFGQAGLLETDAGESEYLTRLRTDYDFYRHKYALQPPQGIQWKTGRMRPANFPHRRIAALAMMIYNGTLGRNSVLNVKTEEEARQMFRFEHVGYWSINYNFSAKTTARARALSEESITVLLINVVVPALYAYGQYTGDESYCTRATDLLFTLKAEQNSVVTMFRTAGFNVPDAFTSQALLRLRRAYCEPRKCIYCRLGQRILSEKAKR